MYTKTRLTFVTRSKCGSPPPPWERSFTIDILDPRHTFLGRYIAYLRIGAITSFS